MPCLPEELWTDPCCIYLRKQRRRLWVELCDLERLRAIGEIRDNVAVVAANLGVSRRQLERDLTEMRALGLVPEGEIWPEFRCPALEEARSEAFTGRQTRPRYASDERYNERRRGQRHAQDVTPPDSAAPPPGEDPSDAAATQSAPPPPTVPVPESGLVPGPEPAFINSPYPVRIPVLESVAERLTELGMDRAKSEERVAEFGAARCRDALEALAASSKPVGKPVGFIVDFLVHQRPLPKALADAREREQTRPPQSCLAPGITTASGSAASALVRRLPFARRRENMVGEPTAEEVSAWRQHLKERLDTKLG